MKTFSLSALLLLFTACTGKAEDDSNPPLTDDVDADGYTLEDGDCDDYDDTVHPGAPESWYDGVDQDCDGNDDDQDEDGFAVADDCDDTDPNVSPDGAEVCDGVDNDCDGSVDQDATDGQVAYADADGDGHGDAAVTTTWCDSVPDGYSTSSDDCDDAEATVYTGAEEICDDLDNDCDGEINEGNPEQVLYYRDADADGYGDAESSTLSCTTPDGYSAESTDCDDSDGTVHPGADEYCDNTDSDCDGNTTNNPVDGTAWYTDSDADGYGDAATELLACEDQAGMVTDGTDCDDTDAGSNPGAVELCDGVDNDCSGTADDGLTFVDYYADADTDGYGDGGTATNTCEQPAGYVTDSTDCDDGDALSYPGAAEICDLNDNDCDGSIDEDAGDMRTYYADGDNDGYGDASVTATDCGAPSGYVESADDCDDANSRVNPGATETCDGLDEDCDGDVDENASDATTYYADADEDGYGDDASMTTSCDPMAGYVTMGEDCDDGDTNVNPSGIEVCDSVDNNCDGTTDEDTAVDASTWYVDVDGDDYGSLAATLVACTEPAGYADDSEDCDDGATAVNPGAIETCNGYDDDCDASVDEAGSTNELTWYYDGDGDGRGDVSPTTEACNAPSGYAAYGDDCDDADAANYPGNAEADDMADNDCDVWVDEDFIGAGDVILSEVARQPRIGAASTTVTAQWFELYNASTRDIDLSNWYFKRSYTSSASFYVDPDAGVYLAAGEYAVFCNRDDYTASVTSDSTLVCDYYYADDTQSGTYSDTYHHNLFHLQANQDTFEIFLGGDDTTGTLIDEVHWTYNATSGYWPQGARRSMALDPAMLNGTDNDDLTSWCLTPLTSGSSYLWYYVSSSNSESGTPGSANYDCP